MPNFKRYKIMQWYETVVDHDYKEKVYKVADLVIILCAYNIPGHFECLIFYLLIQFSQKTLLAK